MSCPTGPLSDTKFAANFRMQEEEHERRRRKYGPVLQKAINKYHQVRRSVRNSIVGDPSKFKGCVEDHTLGEELVPWIVKNIAKHLEDRDDIHGIYETCVDPDEVRRFKKSLIKDNQLFLYDYESTLVAMTLISFFMDMDHTLIPPHLWERTVEAGDREDVDELRQIYSELPPVQQETLGRMIIHLHRIFSRPYPVVDPDTVLRFFGVVLIGHSCPEKVNDPEELIKLYYTMRTFMDIFEISNY